jgi:hypothetical protein
MSKDAATAAAVLAAAGAILLYARKRRNDEDPGATYARPDAPAGQRYKYRPVHSIVYPPGCLQSKIDECRRPGGLVLRDDDIAVTTYPKCGTTVMQQIVLLLQRNGNPRGISLDATGSDTPWIEQVASGRDPAKDRAWLDTLPARRVFKTHACRHLFPAVPSRNGAVCAAAGARLVVVCRNPFDACVSMYHHARDKPVFEYADGEWDDFFGLFMSGQVESGCFFAWHAAAQADPGRILWLHYEALLADPHGTVAAVAAHCRLGLLPSGTVDAALVQRVVSASSFSAMKVQHEASAAKNHFRQGKSGGWRAYFSRAQKEAMERKAAGTLGRAGLDLGTGLALDAWRAVERRV